MTIKLITNKTGSFDATPYVSTKFISVLFKIKQVKNLTRMKCVSYLFELKGVQFLTCMKNVITFTPLINKLD